ncbi:MAG: hypothetical protein II877_05195 [Synergistaceae bacterium]|nr:hypothetical protein [Synergistaceae bacterium]
MSETVKKVLIDGGCPVALGDEETRFIYNLLPVGEFHDKRYGRVSITPAKIQQMADNFGKCPAYEVPVKLGHEQGAKSPGKVIAATAKPEGLEITMLVDAETAQAINEKQYRYMSAEYDEDYHDKKTGEKVGAVLLGAALVNQPAHPYVAPLVLADDVTPGTKTEWNDNNMTELEDLRLQLSEAKAQKAQLEADLKAARELSEDTAKKLADLEAQNKSLLEEREHAENARNEAEVKALCDKWVSKGVAPVMVDKVKPLLLTKQSRTIKLSDDAKDDIPTQKFFDELFELMPKMPMTQLGNSEAPSVELSDVEKAIERGKAIAASVN